MTSRVADGPGGRLEGSVVCVTGAGRGLGRAIARAFDAEGARLVLGARTLPEIDALARSLHDAIALQVDVRRAEEVESLVQAAAGEFGRLDVMVNNAGIAVYGPLENLEPRQVELMVDTNLKGVIYGSQSAFRLMKARRSGHIVNIGSISGRRHLVHEAVYGATKWAVSGFTGTLALEARPYGVKVTAICPGGIDTPFWKAMDFYPFPDTIDPERDFLRPEAVAGVVVDIACTPAAFGVDEVVVTPVITQA